MYVEMNLVVFISSPSFAVVIRPGERDREGLTECARGLVYMVPVGEDATVESTRYPSKRGLKKPNLAKCVFLHFVLC